MLLYDVKERSLLRIERAATQRYSFFVMMFPLAWGGAVSCFQEQSLKPAAIRVESADKE